MQTLSTAQAVVSMLELNGIDTLFCLPGVQNDSFFDALYDRTNAIRPIHARVASDNAGSLKVLRKAGFAITGTEVSYANARNTEIEETLLRLD